MQYYFKSKYEGVKGYPRGWYGTFDKCPPATILLYNDDKGFCIGYVENEEDYNEIIKNKDVIPYNPKEDALAEIALYSIEHPKIFHGTKIQDRWDFTYNKYKGGG